MMPTYNPNQKEYWTTPWNQSSGGQNYQSAYDRMMGSVGNNGIPDVMGLRGKLQGILSQQGQAAESAYNTQNAQQGQQFADIYAQALKAYDPDAINSIYANAFGQLGRNQGASVAGAQRTGAMQAASGSLANPGAFVMGAGQNARAPYAEAFANLGQAQSQAQLAGQKGIMDTMALLNRYKTGDLKDMAELDLRKQQLELQRQQLQAQIDGSEAEFFDYFGAAAPIIGSIIAPGIGTAIGGGMSKFGGSQGASGAYGFNPNYTGSQYVNGKLPWQ